MLECSILCRIRPFHSVPLMFVVEIDRAAAAWLPSRSCANAAARALHGTSERTQKPHWHGAACACQPRTAALEALCAWLGEGSHRAIDRLCVCPEWRLRAPGRVCLEVTTFETVS